jgi:hypothetical protein
MRRMANRGDPEVMRFFSVLDEWKFKCKLEGAR